MPQVERRVILADVEVRQVEGAAPKLVGHGSVFDTETVIGGAFREMVRPGAFRDSVKGDDIRVLFNHDPNYVLGRQSAGTAQIAEDAGGLRYEADVNTADPQAMSVLAKIQRGDVTGSSFSFTIERDEDEEWQPAGKRGGLPLRIVKRARVYDVGPVTFPAYVQAEASARSLTRAGEITEAEQRAVEAAEAAKPEEVKAREALRAEIEKAKAWRK